jgi:hypothetical protein
MDPFTISMGVAGFLSLALEVIKILIDYVGAVKSAPNEARELQTEITALCHPLRELFNFLRQKEFQGRSLVNHLRFALS